MSNDTKAATVSPEDARVDVIKRTAQYGSLSVGQNDVLFLIARISALQSENAGLRGLCGEAHRLFSGNYITVDDPNNTAMLGDLHEKLDRASKGEGHE